MFRIGELRTRMQLKHRVIGDADEFGTPQDTETLYATVYGKIEDLSGRDFKLADQVTTDATTMVTMRFRSDVKATDLIVMDGRTLEVVTAKDPDGYRDELLVSCREFVSQ